MDALIDRWIRAGMRAQEERIRVLDIGGCFYAPSSSRPLGAYALRQTADGWTCECIANSEHGLPCKHLSALADMLGLDVLADIRISDELLPSEPAEAAA